MDSPCMRILALHLQYGLRTDGWPKHVSTCPEFWQRTPSDITEKRGSLDTDLLNHYVVERRL
jgi:hypothetical protein